MSETARTTAAPRTIKLKGKEYRITPLRDRDFGEFETWVQDRAIAIAIRNSKELDEADRQSLIQHAYDKAANITISSPESTRFMASIEGASKLLWLSLHHEHPDLTEDEVLTLLCDPDTLEVAMSEVERTNKFVGGSQNGNRNPPVARKRRRKR